jgi:hypothetical protein
MVPAPSASSNSNQEGRPEEHLPGSAGSQFVALRSLVGDARQAESVDQLRDLLQTQGGEVIFSTHLDLSILDDDILQRFMEQAEALYADWPLAA